LADVGGVGVTGEALKARVVYLGSKFNMYEVVTKLPYSGSAPDFQEDKFVNAKRSFVVQSDSGYHSWR
jgi:hypothetical protein